ncbi:hypothetical protein PC9H_005001 [Pleurotus ostreatus]|uniref:Uncharacterized protein n=1 Tax=Pleurotus ostreatus TaxID=5322 RepID=A0A8H6ZW93_PLEOS|nr:uncharacterized protein PC9H_005001 [Pleurotus ostreatus]KAF7433055.1 hypothetical protein PC9H_005001 [Pleurotus ostreatus]
MRKRPIGICGLMFQFYRCMVRRATRPPSVFCLLSSVSVFYHPGDWVHGDPTRAAYARFGTPNPRPIFLLPNLAWLSDSNHTTPPSYWPNQLENSQGRPADQLGVNNSDAPVLAAISVAERGNQTNLIKSSTYFKLSCRPEPIANVICGLDPYNDDDEWNPKYLGGQAVPVIGQGPGARVDSKPICSRLSTSTPSLESVEDVLKGHRLRVVRASVTWTVYDRGWGEGGGEQEEI